MIKRLFRFLASATLLLVGSSLTSVIACSCLGPGPPCQAYWNSEVVFTGRALSVARVEVDWEGQKIPRRLFRFKLEKSFRGNSDALIDVLTGLGGGDCGYDFELGVDYLVYGATVTGKPWVGTSICSRTQTVANAREDLEFLRALPSSPAGARIFGTALKFTVNFGNRRLGAPGAR